MNQLTQSANEFLDSTTVLSVSVLLLSLIDFGSLHAVDTFLLISAFSD